MESLNRNIRMIKMHFTVFFAYKRLANNKALKKITKYYLKNEDIGEKYVEIVKVRGLYGYQMCSDIKSRIQSKLYQQLIKLKSLGLFNLRKMIYYNIIINLIGRN